MTRLSVCVPVFNEQAVVPELVSRLVGVINRLDGGPHNVVFVDDGSTDNTVQLLVRHIGGDSRFRIVVLSRNFGHQAALTAGLDYVEGDAVVTMDGDLQDEPEVIPTLLQAYHDGADVVYARRVDRKEGIVLRAAYHAAYRTIAALSDVELPNDTGDFALLSRRALEAIRSLPERQRYVRGLRAWVGFRQVGIDVERRRRAGGTSKYRVGDLVALALDGVFAFSTVPLRAASITGAVAIVTSMAFAAYAMYARIVVGQVPEGFTATLVVMTFLAGVQLLFLGVIGEYVGRIYAETKSRPVYVVSKVIGCDE